MPAYDVEIASGARLAEAAVLRRVTRLRREAVAGGSGLSCPPILVVVPSQTLRVHVLRKLAVEGGSEAALGVRCQTVYGVARELAAPHAGASDPDLTAFLAERFARQHPELAFLEGLADGYAAVAVPIHDLLDAGFEPAHLEGLLEALEASEARGTGAVARARALLAVAAQVDAACAAVDLPARHLVYRRAADAVLRGDGPRLHAVVAHGFAEATGVVTDLLHALLRTHGGCLVLDRPRDPFEPDRPAAAGRFTQRLHDRLLDTAAALDETSAAAPAARLDLVCAPRPEAEVEEVAHRILDLLDAGTAPEDIAAVVRDPAPYRLALRRRLGALGVPFSAFGIAGPTAPERRRLSGLLALLQEGAQHPVERWLSLVPPMHGASAPDLALAMAARGAGRLLQAAALAETYLAGDEPIRLPLRRVRAVASPDEDDETGTVDEPGGPAESDAREWSRHPEIPRQALRETVERVRAVCRHLERWSTPRRLGEHLEALESLVHDALGWEPEARASVMLEEQVMEPLRRLAPELAMTFEEFRRLLARSAGHGGPTLPAGSQHSLGGAGGGVQVMDVTAARGRTCEHLFLLGLNRGNFPRRVREDPMLPDAVRDSLATGGYGPLPDLPRKRLGHDEELHLFAQLLSSAPHVTLTWSQATAAGDAAAPSPWIERLAGGPAAAPHAAADLWGDPGTATAGARDRLARRPPREWARLAGLHGRRHDFARVLPAALEAASGEVEPNVLVRRSAARLATLDELDPEPRSHADRRARSRLGPFLGLLGSPGPGDPRGTQPLWITRVEAFARCPWQHLLEHVLQIEPWPDPVADLPALDGALVGSFVHELLQAIAARSGAPENVALAAAMELSPTPVDWPSTAALEALALRLARASLERRGIELPGLALGLVERTRPMLEHAHALAWPDSSASLLGVELDGEVEAGGERIAFRADQAVAAASGPRLVDFKTGAVLTEAKKETTRRAHLLAAISRGDALQPAAYAFGGGPGAQGVVFYVTDREVDTDEARSLAIASDDGEARERWEAAAGTLLAAWRAGIHLPRLNEARPGDRGRPDACKWCRVKEACLQGESVVRIRQRRWADAHEAHPELPEGIERRAAALWWMRDAQWATRHAAASAPASDDDGGRRE